MVVSCCIIIQPQLGQFVNKIGSLTCNWQGYLQRFTFCAAACHVAGESALPLRATLRRSTRISIILPVDVPFGTPKGTEKGPATSESAGGPAQGRWVRALHERGAKRRTSRP